MTSRTRENGWIGRRLMLGGMTGLAAGVGFEAGAQPAGVRTPGGVLRVAAPTNPSTMDPMTGRSGADHIQLYTVYDTLVEWEYNTLTALPGLAKAWHFPDPATLVLELQTGVVFHDGSPFDAEAVKANLDRGRTDPGSNIKADLASIASVEVSGPAQVTLKLLYPDTALPLILSDRAGMMVSPRAAASGGTGLDRAPVGTGPWKFVSWSDGNNMIVTRNDKYWKPGLPYLDQIKFQFIPDSNTALRSVISGENDLAYQLTARQKPVLNREPSLVAVQGPTVALEMFYFNMGRPPLDDVRVRQAINYAIDRSALDQVTQLGLAEIATSILPKEHWAHASPMDSVYPHDPAKAKRLLAEAGHGGGLTLKLLSWSDQSAQQRQEVLADQLRKVGITLQTQIGTIAETAGWFYGPEKKGDLFLSAWSGRPDPSLTLLLLFGKDSYYNAGHVEPEGFPAALARTRSVAGQEQRAAAMAGAQKIVADNALFGPTLFEPGIAVHTKKVVNFRSNLLGKPKFVDVSLAS